MTSVLSHTADLADLRTRVAGRILTPDAAGYAELATPWNVAVPSRPVAVVEVVDAADVSAIVTYAAQHQLDVAVQLTGHGATTYSRPTLLVHTILLDEITISATGSARVGAGIRWHQLLSAAAPLGLAGLCGSAPDVGVVGYLTGGGLSPVARTFGFASDHVTAFDVVTGDGELRRATATENPALFWALRGGKGALGIVVAVEFDLFPVAEIFGGCSYFDGADAAVVSHAWRDWSATLPEQASTSIAIMRLPDMPGVPGPLAGRTTVAVRFAWVGDPEEGRRVFSPMETVAPVILGGMGVLPFEAIGAIHSDPVDPMPTFERGVLLRELPATALDALLATAGPAAPSPLVIVELRLLGGAIARQPQHPSAVGHRDAAFHLLLIGLDIPPLIAPTEGNAAQIMSALQPWSYGHTLPNFGVSSDPARVAANYETATLARLATLAATYDPHGVISAAHAVRAACVALS